MRHRPHMLKHTRKSFVLATGLGGLLATSCSGPPVGEEAPLPCELNLSRWSTRPISGLDVGFIDIQSSDAGIAIEGRGGSSKQELQDYLQSLQQMNPRPVVRVKMSDEKCEDKRNIIQTIERAYDCNVAKCELSK
jgi:hypothetical protein